MRNTPPAPWIGVGGFDKNKNKFTVCQFLKPRSPFGVSAMKTVMKWKVEGAGVLRTRKANIRMCLLTTVQGDHGNLMKKAQSVVRMLLEEEWPHAKPVGFAIVSPDDEFENDGDLFLGIWANPDLLKIHRILHISHCNKNSRFPVGVVQMTAEQGILLGQESKRYSKVFEKSAEWKEEYLAMPWGRKK